MTYDEALAFWFGRINYEVRVPKPGDLKLDRMRGLLELLGNPHQRLRLVHVAGSKGKGSTSAMLATILQRAGYRIGLFTSPHLTRVEERFQIDGAPITSVELTALLTEIRDLLRNRADQPTFFEIATAVGFLHFARRRVDVAVIEVGLGGRFDSTNVCRPLVSLITSISYDHTQQLGTRLDQIAMEKAGIVKPGVPCISAATPPEARQVIEAICRERGAPLQELARDFHFDYATGEISQEPRHDRRARVHVVTPRQQWPWVEVGLLGEHQAANAAVTLAAAECLRQAGLHIPYSAVTNGLREVSWPARLEVLGRRPLVVLDCAHNVASAESLRDTLLDSFPACRRFLIFAGSGDKDLAGMLNVLGRHFSHIFLTRYTNSPRGVPPEQLGDYTKGPHTLCPTPKEAWTAALGAATPDDLICVTGSVFLAGELRPLLIAHDHNVG